MPATNATVTVGIQYTPPSASVNSGNVSYQVTASSAAQNVGQIDVNPADAPGTLYSIPFGSIAAAKILVIKNRGAQEYGLRLNGAIADTIRLPTGGEFAFVASSVPTGGQITTVDVAVVASPATTEFIEYFVYGD